ncbi:MAG: hypothetical protein QXI60_05170 [Thermofilaceae archaeon]
MHINRAEQGIIEALEALAEFLNKASLLGRANRIESLKEQLLQGQSEPVIEALLGVEFWGSAGSYLDLVICRESFPSLPNDTDSAALNREYISLLFRLADSLKQAHLSSHWLDSAYEILRKWAGSL